VAGSVRTVRPRWAGAVFICGKCLKRHKDGKAVRKALKTEAQNVAAERSSGKVRIVKTACVGLCPRQAVVVSSAVTLFQGEVLIVSDAKAASWSIARLLP
jgi:predicted metal-binding protein